MRVQVTFMPLCHLQFFGYLTFWLRSDDDKKEFSIDFFYHLFSQNPCIMTEATCRYKYLMDSNPSFGGEKLLLSRRTLRRYDD